MPERRYDEDEVREIFALATTGDTRERALPADRDGLTLEELQRIGEEAGIEPTRVIDAALSLESRGRVAPVRRSAGLPVGVSRVVELPRAPTDREWELLISEFRSTFGAQGTVSVSGGLRDWSVGALHVSIEPTARGEQMRLTTLKEDALIFNGLAGMMSTLAVLVGAILVGKGEPNAAVPIVSLFGGIAAIAFGSNVIRLPRWARKREAQMAALGEHAVKLLSAPRVE